MKQLDREVAVLRVNDVAGALQRMSAFKYK